MTLLITVFSAIAATIIWYNQKFDDRTKTGVLCFMYWGAAIMWFVDAVFEYAELQSQYFTPALSDMVNDAYLGLSVTALGLIIWLVVLLISDPQKVVRNALMKK
ncbi:MAG: hypothetical protein Q4F63_02490 [Clostridia bacterium]|nr:hypothetical protein [Clostridia bacterium]